MINTPGVSVTDEMVEAMLEASCGYSHQWSHETKKATAKGLEAALALDPLRQPVARALATEAAQTAWTLLSDVIANLNWWRRQFGDVADKEVRYYDKEASALMMRVGDARLAWATQSPERPCQTCGGTGEIGGFVGSVGSGAEGYQTDPCPDCSPSPDQPSDDAPRDAEIDRIIGLIIRDVCEIERDPLPDQPHGEIRITVDELRMILDERLK